MYMTVTVVVNVCTTSGSQYLLKHTQGIGIQILTATTQSVIFYSQIPALPCPVPYSGKIWWGKSLANWASRSFGEGKFGEYQ